MMETTLIENGDTSGQYHAMGAAGSVSAHGGSEQGCQCKDGQQGQSGQTVRVGSKTFSYEDLLMILVVLQLVALLFDLYGEVSG